MMYSSKLVTESKSSALVYILGSFLFVHSSIPQTPSPYELKTGREIALLGAGAAIQGALFGFNSTIDPLTPADVSALNRADVNSFDRKATYLWSTSAATLSDVTLAGNAAVFGILA